MPSDEMKRLFDNRGLDVYHGKVGESALYFEKHRVTQIELNIIKAEGDIADAHAKAVLLSYAKDHHASCYSRYFYGKEYAHAQCEAEDLSLLYRIKLTNAHRLRVEANRLRNEELLVMECDGVQKNPHPVLREIMTLHDNAPAVGILVTVPDATTPLEYTVFSAKECFDPGCVGRRIEPTQKNFAGRVLKTLCQIAYKATDETWEGKNWGTMAFGKRGTVARVMAELDSDNCDRARWQGYGKYKLDMRQLGNFRDLLCTGPPLLNNRSERVSNDWYQCDQEEFFDALEGARPKADGPFGVIRLTCHLSKQRWSHALIQVLLGYAQEHVEELRDPAPLLNKKPASEPLVVVTRVINRLQASIYPTLLAESPPTPRPWSPTLGAREQE